jgi:hypothetical protein
MDQTTSSTGATDKRECPLLAQSCHRRAADQRPLSGVKQTSQFMGVSSAFDPKRTFVPVTSCWRRQRLVSSPVSTPVPGPTTGGLTAPVQRAPLGPRRSARVNAAVAGTTHVMFDHMPAGRTRYSGGSEQGHCHQSNISANHVSFSSQMASEPALVFLAYRPFCKTDARTAALSSP